MSPIDRLTGVVFDCDGTLADTEPVSDRAWADLLVPRGYVPTEEDHLATVGRPYPHTFAHFAARAPLGDPDAFRVRLRERFLARLADEVRVFEDAVGTLREVAALGVPVAVASSSARSHVERVLDLAGIRELVRVIVSADDVGRHKPEPDPYCRAAELLGAQPGTCTAVEDTAVGIASAKAAGMFTVAVARGYVPRDQLQAADRTVDHLRLADLEPPWTR